MYLDRRVLGVALISASIVGAAPAFAATWNEGTNGDLSNNQASPSTLALTVGANFIDGSVGNGATSDTQDWIAVTVPAGAVMTSYTNTAYGGTDQQGFTGFQFGSSFVGNAGTATPYAGYAHFGPGATNPGINSGAPTSTTNIDLLSTAHYMSDNGPGGTAAGASGYTPPLGPGTYTFLIQQLGSTINYDFRIDVVPEPSTLCLAGVGGAGLLGAVYRRRREVRGEELKGTESFSVI
jgi:hypothetical protein